MDRKQLRTARSAPALRDDRKQAIYYGSEYDEPLPQLPPKYVLVSDSEICPNFDEQLDKLELLTPAEDRDFPPELAQAASKPSKSSKVKTAIGTALSDTKHFAGGLISHPFEATRHYAVLRHSFGLMYYHGPTTNVVITIFSDHLLPPGRTLWLQRRGYSGKTGLAVATVVGTRSAWIDVTPTLDATPDMLEKQDERAWQRDIDKFLNKARDSRSLKKQRPCETNIVRIPHSCEDGYFRIVICDGRKVLCPSPVFRCASTSLDPSMLRGASLRTLPLELGIKMGAVVARNAAHIAAQKALTPAAAIAQNAMRPLTRDGVVTSTASATYSSLDVSTRAAEVKDLYGRRRALALQPATGGSESPALTIGNDNGSKSPYPIRMTGTVASRSRQNQTIHGLAIANIINVDKDQLLRLAGVYAAWAKIRAPRDPSQQTLPLLNYERYYKALVFVAREQTDRAAVVERKAISAHILQDFGGAEFVGCKMNIMIMGYIRPLSHQSGTHDFGWSHRDIAIVQASLERSSWSPEPVLQRMRTETSSRSFNERMTDAIIAGQNHLHKVPVHLLGVRTESMGIKDKLLGIGGIRVQR